MKKHPYDEAADRLLSEFPSVRILGREKRRGGHRALTLEFEGRRR